MLNIYTDGGCRHNPGLGAWAFIVVADDKILHQQSASKPHTTNNEMELTAILKSLEYLEQRSGLEHLEPLDPITIFSDSQYSINAITLWYPKWLAQGVADTKKNISLIRSIYNLLHPKPTAKIVNCQLSIINCQFQWVKGHATNPFNNLADRLVNQAMDAQSLPQPLPPEASPTPHTLPQ